MAITNGLITAAEYSAYTGVTVPTGTRLTQWESAIEVASRRIETHTGRQFHKSDTDVSPTATARYYDAEGGLVQIDDAYSVTTVELDSGDDGTHATATTNYQLLPPYGRSPILGDVAYTALLPLTGLYWPCGNARRGSVKVTALWGWSAVPDTVKRATEVFVQDLLRDPDTDFGGLSINAESGLVVGSRIPDRTLTLLEPYVRYSRTVGIA